MKTFYVYMLSSHTRTLYIGVTSNLVKRLAEHRSPRHRSFSGRYRVTRLVYFETTPNARAAIAREKQIKGWSRRKKMDLIETVNPKWEDLSSGWPKGKIEIPRCARNDNSLNARNDSAPSSL